MPSPSSLERDSLCDICGVEKWSVQLKSKKVKNHTVHLCLKCYEEDEEITENIRENGK